MIRAMSLFLCLRFNFGDLLLFAGKKVLQNHSSARFAPGIPSSVCHTPCVPHAFVRDAPVNKKAHQVILPWCVFSFTRILLLLCSPAGHCLRSGASLAHCSGYTAYATLLHLHCVSIALILRALLSSQTMALAETSVHSSLPFLCRRARLGVLNWIFFSLSKDRNYTNFFCNSFKRVTPFGNFVSSKKLIASSKRLMISVCFLGKRHFLLP